ncbi:hypothetical protein PUN28_005376 [Cardiocondyla obscurior]|uniref:Ribosomal protein L33 n=1 Tax=Cardiocondyla obscurior TaxID=286306 RepID=A0AAW2GFK3_9HYME
MKRCTFNCVLARTLSRREKTDDNAPKLRTTARTCPWICISIEND